LHICVTLAAALREARTFTAMLLSTVLLLLSTCSCWQEPKVERSAWCFRMRRWQEGPLYSLCIFDLWTGGWLTSSVQNKNGAI